MKRTNNFYTKGRNVWGDRVKTELIIAQNDYFVDQINYVVTKIAEYQKKGKEIEFTFDYRQLTPDNMKAFDFILELKMRQIA